MASADGRLCVFPIHGDRSVALISPQYVPSIRSDAGWYREIDVLERLKDSLPDAYEIFHSVTWHTIHQGTDRHGEIDLVVLGPTGNILLIEVKAGDVILRDGEIFKLYSNKEHDVGRQCRVQYASILNRLQEAGIHPYVTNCLVLPDYKMGSASLVAFPRDRIVDSDQYNTLGTIVRGFLTSGQGENDVDACRRFLNNEFRVSTKLSVLRDQVQSTTEQLSDGLATWVPRIDAPSKTIRIQATAGSGKTQLAVRLLEDAIARGQSAIYVCFNRSLADYMARLAPTRANVANYHDLCVEHFRRRHGEPDFSDPEIFQKVVNLYREDSEGFQARYDLLLIDEGQDFEPGWVETLFPQLKDEGWFYLMEDQDQQLYERDSFDLSEAVLISCFDNFRSPKAICQAIDAFSLASQPIQSRGFYIGDVPGFHLYSSEHDLVKKTAEVIDGLIARGFVIEDIVVLTGRGVKKSVVLKADQIGKYSTRRFTGRYSTQSGLPEWTDGDLLVESVYRYKGQAAPVVVMTEVDFTEMTPLERKKLFVGLTRATMAVEIVMTPQAEQLFMACLK